MRSGPSGRDGWRGHGRTLAAPAIGSPRACARRTCRRARPPRPSAAPVRATAPAGRTRGARAQASRMLGPQLLRQRTRSAVPCLLPAGVAHAHALLAAFNPAAQGLAASTSAASSARRSSPRALPTAAAAAAASGKLAALRTEPTPDPPPPAVRRQPVAPFPTAGGDLARAAGGAGRAEQGREERVVHHRRSPPAAARRPPPAARRPPPAALCSRNSRAG